VFPKRAMRNYNDRHQIKVTNIELASLDRGLITLGTVIVLSVASATMWHVVVKSYAWAVIGSSLTVGVATYFGYPIFRDVAPSALILMNALVLGAVIALGVGVPFKRRRMGKSGASNDA